MTPLFKVIKSKYQMDAFEKLRISDDKIVVKPVSYMKERGLFSKVNIKSGDVIVSQKAYHLSDHETECRFCGIPCLNTFCEGHAACRKAKDLYAHGESVNHWFGHNNLTRIYVNATRFVARPPRTCYYLEKGSALSFVNHACEASNARFEWCPERSELRLVCIEEIRPGQEILANYVGGSVSNAYANACLPFVSKYEDADEMEEDDEEADGDWQYVQETVKPFRRILIKGERCTSNLWTCAKTSGKAKPRMIRGNAPTHFTLIRNFDDFDANPREWLDLLHYYNTGKLKRQNLDVFFRDVIVPDFDLFGNKTCDAEDEDLSVALAFLHMSRISKHVKQARKVQNWLNERYSLF